MKSKNKIIKQNKVNMEAVGSKLSHEIEETQKEIKQEKKFNFKAWLLTSCFSIISCGLGLANLILNLTKNK